jgi:hypothetical protein
MKRLLRVLLSGVFIVTMSAWAQSPSQSPSPARQDTASTTKSGAESAGPKIYRWVDSAGRAQFGSSPPPGTQTETVAVRDQELGGGTRIPAGMDVVDRRNQTAPAPSYDWDAERPKRLAEHCGFIRERVKELRAGQEWIVLDWGKPPTRLDGPRRVEELVKRERLLRQYCEGY